MELFLMGKLPVTGFCIEPLGFPDKDNPRTFKGLSEFLNTLFALALKHISTFLAQ